MCGSVAVVQMNSIEQAIEKVDAALRLRFENLRCEHRDYSDFYPCRDCERAREQECHRLVREVAKVAQERMRERAQIYIVDKVLCCGIAEELDVRGKQIHEAIAALPLESGDKK